MSSEKRAIAPYNLDSDVPPLKTAVSLSTGRLKMRASSQTTQKSFSTITGLTLFP